MPLRPEEDFDVVRGFARDVAPALVSRSPGQLTMEQRQERRGQRLYLDIMRNAFAQTVITHYAVRARRGAPVATPLHWGRSRRATLARGSSPCALSPAG
jgi:bifunctional non-homologous end joining protein LigD